MIVRITEGTLALDIGILVEFLKLLLFIIILMPLKIID
jgi:hypothetical protein